MYGIVFEWDPVKSRSNLRKHGVRFEDAALVFQDPLHISAPDSVVRGEQRWRTYGRVEGLYLLVVAHTTRETAEDGTEIELVRIISARRAEPREERWYERENG